MPIQLYIGFTVEGTTDTKFLTEIIDKVFTETALGCRTDVTIEDVRIIDVPKSSFVETMIEASKRAICHYGISILCIHADSDAKSVRDVETYKFAPLRLVLDEKNDSEFCKVIVPIIPIQMTESWMLANIDLFKEKIGAKNIQNIDLGIHREPESYADPKQNICDAIRLAQSGRTKRRRNNLTINDLYYEMGQSLSLDDLRRIPSFCSFEDNVKRAFSELGYFG